MAVAGTARAPEQRRTHRGWIAVGFGVLTVVLLSGLRYVHRAEAVPARRILFYRDPMHPSLTSPRPGKAPDCGMDLVPVFADSSATPLIPPGFVQVSPERQQLVGVRLGTVERSSSTQSLRALGRVVVDEARVFPVTASAEGWVTRIFAGGTGSRVHKGQPLVAVYGREYTTAQRALLYALRAVENSPPLPAGDYQDSPALTLQEARLNLVNMGMGDAQIEQIANRRQVMLDVTLTAPASGVLVARNVFPRQRFDRGAELFRIEDLSRVWVLAEFLGEEARNIRSGAVARVSMPGGTGTALRATVSGALSAFDPVSQRLKVRLETANPDLILRPGMSVDLEFPVKLPPSINVPADALVESGLRKIVFVERDQGIFEPRPVETGWRFGDRVQIVRGLNPGETIALAGNFLLDSESRLQRSDSPPPINH